MWEAVVAVIGLVGSAIAAAIAAYAGTRRRVLAELEAQYDSKLRDSRLGVYPKLWAELEPLAKYAREPPGYPARDEITRLSVALRKWYFQTGGIYLSAEAREAYFQLQDALTTVVTSKRWKAVDDTSDQLDGETFERLRKIGSWLRTTLTYDVGTRRQFSFAAESHAAADLKAKQETSEALAKLRSSWPAAAHDGAGAGAELSARG
jgi:hypothetical protein